MIFILLLTGCIVCIPAGVTFPVKCLFLIIVTLNLGNSESDFCRRAVCLCYHCSLHSLKCEKGAHFVLILHNFKAVVATGFKPGTGFCRTLATLY